MTTAFITGITGFVGSHLADYLLERDVKVFGLTRWRSPKENIVHCLDRITLLHGDLLDPHSLRNALNTARPDIVFHLAAQSVAEEEFIPILKSHSLEMVTFGELWTTCRKRNEVEKVNNQGIASEVINLEKSQLRAISFFNGMGNWLPIKQISRHKYKGDIVELRQKFGSVRVTPNHCVINKFGKLCSAESSPDLLPMRNLNYYNQRQCETIKLTRTNKYKYEDGYFCIENVPNKKLTVELDRNQAKNFVQFCAAYIAEGCAHSRDKKRNFTVTISNNDKQWLEDINENLELFSVGMSGKFAVNKKEGYLDGNNMVVTSELLYDVMIKYCGQGSKNKCMPDFIFQLSSHLQECFLEKLAEGDGCYQERKNYKTFRYTTASRKLASQICFLLTLLKKDYTVYQDDNDCFFIRECKYYQPNQGISDKKIKQIKYDGYVYDISVGEPEVFAVGVGSLVVHNSYVPYSFIAPSSTLDTNIVGTCNLLEVIKSLRTENYDPIIHVCSCYDEDTELLTRRGFLAYKEIKMEDQVVSIDPVSRNVSYHPIKKIIIQKYTGSMYKISTRSADLLITPNHKLLFSSTKNGKLKFSCLNDLEKSSKRYYFSKGRSSGNASEEFLIGNKYYKTEDLFYLVGLYIGDGYSRTQKRKQVNKSGLTREEFVARRSCKGQFVSERTGTKQFSTVYSHRAFLAIPDGDKARFPAIKCLSDMGISFKLYRDDIYFSSKCFVDFFDQFGHTAHDKHIPEWMFEYDARFLDRLYQGLIDSDGCYYKTGERYTTVSQKLSDDLTRLCCFTGRFATVSMSKAGESTIKGRVIKSGPAYRFSISSNSRLVENKNISTVNYSGDVWCLEVDSVHNFVVRRNGKTHFCGNSSEVYGQVCKEEVPIKEDNPFRPASPYAVSKVGEDMLAFQYYSSWNMKILRTRLFTHSGPRRGDVFVVSNFAKQIALIEAGKQDHVLKVGNLDSIRTFMDVRDAVRAYWLLVTKCPAGEVYNIGGITTMTVGEMLNKLLNLSSKSIDVVQDEERLRPSDVTLQIPSTEKFRKATGWQAEINFDTTLTDTLNYWRGRLK